MGEAIQPPPVGQKFDSVLAKLRQKRQELQPDAIAPVDRGVPGFPLSFGQQRIWFLEQLQPGTAIYNVAAAVRLHGPVDDVALQRALTAVVARHEALRTVFAAAEAEVWQRVAPPPAFRLPRIDLRALARPEPVALALASGVAARPFDLGADLLLRAVLVVLGERDHVLVFAVHHIVTDAWSMGLLVRDVARLYEAAATGRPPALPELPIQYVDYAAWQRRWFQGDRLERHLAYWRRQLADSPALLALPTDRPRAAVWGARGSRVFLRLERALADALRGTARRQGTALFAVLLAAFQTLLHRTAAAADLLIGVPIANRRRGEIEHLIGFFVNTLVLRSRAAGDTAFAALLASTAAASLDAFEHQDLPFEKLVEQLQPERSLTHSPLFQVVFVFQNIPVADLDLRGVTFAPLPVDRGAAMFDLTFNLAEIAGGLEGWLEYSSDLFDAATVRRMGEHYAQLLAAVAAGAETAVERLPLLAAAELHQVTVEWNDTRWAAPASPATALHHLFAAQAARTPDAVAVASGAALLTYGGLAAAAAGLAGRLIALGVGPEARVGVHAERSLELVVGLLAVLAAGGAYVPLDPDHPRERLAFVLADAGIDVLLVERRLRGNLPPHAGRIVELDPLGPPAALAAPAPAVARRAAAVRPENLCYVLYTSGSTGRPKGAMNTHGALVNRLLWMQAAYRLDATDAVLQKTPFGFDVSVWELFWPLATGARLVMALPGAHRDPESLAAAVADGGITTLHFVPSMLRAFLEARGAGHYRGLRRVIASGEALGDDLAAAFFSRFPEVALHNLYGPTEAAIDVTAWACARGAEDRPVPIGRPIANLRTHLLDGSLGAVPLGTPAELYLAGAGLGRGYAGRPDLTAERFLPEAFAGAPGARMYRTGDLARHRADGAIEFLGRTDHQVKIRGFRIELGEIEAVLAAHPGVAEAVVVARHDGAGGPRLVAYVVVAAGAAAPAPAELARHLGAALPAYMVPAWFLPLAALPLSPNGKVDRRALPPPPAPAGAEGAAAPRSPAEELMCEIWADVLGLPRVGPQDNFFALGGHSLLVPRLLARLRHAFGRDVPLGAVFNHPTAAALVEAMAAAASRPAAVAAAAPLVRRDRGEPPGPLPLSPSQLRFWRRRHEGGGAVHIPWGVLLDGAVDARLLARAIAEIVRRHQVLRTAFGEVDGEPFQQVLAAVPGELPVVDLSALPEARRQDEAGRLGRLAATRPFDLAAGRLLRATLLVLAPGEHALFVVKHHLVTDGWSEGIFADELAALYRAFLAGEPSPLAEPALQYGDFAAWQGELLAGELCRLQLGHWQERLRGLRVLPLPVDRPRPARRGHRGALARWTLPASLASGLHQLGRRESVSLFMTLLAAWKALLAQWTGELDVTLTTNVANRTRPEVERLIGVFTNIVALRTSLAGDPTFRELLGRVRATTLDAFAHQDLPFPEVLSWIAADAGADAAAYNDLLPVGFVLQNFPRRPLDLPGIEVRRFDLAPASAPRDLILIAAGDEVELRVMLLYRQDIFTPPAMDALLARFVQLLALVCDDPGQPLSRLASANTIATASQ